ncbi:indole-3-glycerol phosphate synthase-like [Klebsormidium nitens]|uniref:indole-3-glycerol-phosphate synthase n=1 Tax=Klebsormidium nitens TaxID=105231 RepID=A0A1Y1HUJ4_KLENI|nr:indole-3-glycerol phosphate synthase-like [Klebsormidium nitens]|eukprot:GAQ80661.1 indole-3-glycerol phosphate synthase-like [Klebsormidium nitens]
MRKQVKLNAELQRLGPDGLEEKLRSVPRPRQPNRLLELIAERTVRGQTTLIVEVGRASPSETSEQLAERAAALIEWGADAVAVCTDEELTPDGRMDLVTVCHRLGNTPVLCRDWILHPIQIVDITRSGAAGFNLVQAVLGEGTPALLKIGLATGLDPIIEVVNKDQVEKVVGGGGATLFGVNISVGLSVSIPGFRQDVAKSLVQQLPFGAASVVGVSSVDEARIMRAAGTDAIWLKREALQSGKGEPSWEDKARSLLEQLSYVLIGDD